MITLYSSNGCRHCTELKDQLIKRGIDFDWQDLDDDAVRDKALAICEKSGETELPIVVIDDVVYHRPSIDVIVQKK